MLNSRLSTAQIPDPRFQSPELKALILAQAQKLAVY